MTARLASDADERPAPRLPLPRGSAPSPSPCPVCSGPRQMVADDAGRATPWCPTCAAGAARAEAAVAARAALSSLGEVLATDSPPTVVTLCRDAVRLLETYAAACSAALHCATEGSAAPQSTREAAWAREGLVVTLGALADLLHGRLVAIWHERADLALRHVIDAEGWARDLEALERAQPTPRDTLAPEPVALAVAGEEAGDVG